MDIEVTGLEHALAAVNRYTGDGLRDRVLEIARRLCEVGEPIVRAAHGGHAEITITPTRTGYRLNCSGQDVLFVEFGAGDAAGRYNSLYTRVPPETRPGTWSSTHAQMYVRYGWWVFAGQIYREVVPNPSLYDATIVMLREFPRIAGEVFR